MKDFENAYVVDDLLPEDLAVEVSNELHSDEFWKSLWRSTRKDLTDGQWHWHREIWQDQTYMPEIDPDKEENYPNIKKLWSAVSEVMLESMGVAFLPVRAYANAHTYGVNGLPHTDDGIITVIYYPCQDWDPIWEGGTALYTEDRKDCLRYCTYKFNRLFMFPARTWHRGMPVTKECSILRRIVVFKCKMDITDPLYEKMYYAQQ